MKSEHFNNNSINKNIFFDRTALMDQLIAIPDRSIDAGQAMMQICELLSGISLPRRLMNVRIVYDGKIYTNVGFEENEKKIERYISIPGDQRIVIESFLTKEWKDDLKNGISKAEKIIESLLPVLKAVICEFRLGKVSLDIRERQKEMKSISRAIGIMKKGLSLDELLQEICNTLPEAMLFPKRAMIRIVFDKKIFESRHFEETPLFIRKNFNTSYGKKGSIEVFYRESDEEESGDPFLKEEYQLIDNLSSLITGSVSRNSLQKLLYNNNERLKELKGINETTQILQKGHSLEESFKLISTILPNSWQYPEKTVVRICYGGKVFTSPGFKETKWKMVQKFHTPDRNTGTIEICYLEKFPDEDEGPFLKEERNLLVNLANIIAGSATREVFHKLNDENTERLKELKAINRTSIIMEEGFPPDETFIKICSFLPKSWQYPTYAVARITYEDKTYTSPKFKETKWCQSENFITIDNIKGKIEIFYLKEFPKEYEGPFLKEERNLLNNIALLIAGFLNNYKGRVLVNKKNVSDIEVYSPKKFRDSLFQTKKPLQLYFNQQAMDKYIYLDMMRYKVKHILFVATLYDAYILESEDSFFERFMGTIYQYSLFSVPRITGVSSPDEALNLLETTGFDLVILMAGMDSKTTISLSKKIKQKNSSLQVYLLMNKDSNNSYLEKIEPQLPSIDKLFVWNGDSSILFAIVKSTEDRINVENDTKIGLVRVILLIEDSPLYYSRYLQMLYSIVFGQVQQLLPEVEKNELDKISKIRSRPKILYARNYEDGISIFNKYKDFMLCVISDMEFDRGGKLNKNAGVEFIRYIKLHISNLPIILQSSDERNASIAKKLNVTFLNKNSDTLLNDLKHYLSRYLGFGNFIFRDKKGNKIGEAKSLREFENLFCEVPEESIRLHASENQFSLWLMVRGEIQLARELNPISVNDFKNIEEFRKYILGTFKKYREEKKKGKILKFEETSVLDEKNIVSFSGGSLGGKGRGLGLIDTLIYNLDLPSMIKGINVFTPITVVIGSDEFVNFISKNNLFKKITDPNISYNQLRELFAEASLSSSLMKKLKIFVNQIDRPIAVRSSSASEDSSNQPFAGVFDTFLIPNSSDNKKMVLKRLSLAIRLVYVSTYSDKAKNFFSILHHNIADEKMSVVLQELIGNQYGNYYYPHISGVAQSYNYYPVENMSPDDGSAVAAVGLGSYVVNGWKSFRFSPRLPNVDMYSVKDLLNSTQVKFYALDCSERPIDFVKNGELAAMKLLDISEAEKHGTLTHCVSVYDANNDRLEPGLDSYGPRVVNFANILKYNYIPLAETISILLDSIREAFGSPVEIEYAVDLNKGKNDLPTFYLLQIKPLLFDHIHENIDFDHMDKEKMLLFTKSGVGNGRVEDIKDVIYVDNDKFSKLYTRQMAEEIAILNNRMVKAEKPYILIGPGRWGSRDRFVGIPVVWPQISNAKVIVETSLNNYPLDSSLGSHFFHNVTSMNIGYFSVKHNSITDFIRWDVLDKQKLVNRTTYFKHICFKKSLTVLMDGRKKTSMILFNKEEREMND